MELGNKDRKKEHFDDYLSNMQRLILDGAFSDVTLLSEGKRFPSYRLLLSASSDYFETMFTSSFKERDSEEIQINDVEADDLQKLIEVCYSGILDINPDNAESLLKGAHLLQLRTAIKICCDYIWQNLQPDNCLRYWLLVKKLMLKDYEEILFQFCLHNFQDISPSQYVELSHEELDEIVRSTDLVIRTEGDVFDIIMSWVQHEPNNRLKYFSTLATRVDFKLVMPSQFSKYLDFFFQFEETVKFQQNMMKFYLTSKNEEFLEPFPRKSNFALLSLSPDGVEIYKRKLGQWSPYINTKLLEIIKYAIYAVHIESNESYFVLKSRTDQITISFLDLKNGTYNSNFYTTPLYIKHNETVITFSYPMVYFIGNDKTICEFNLMTKDFRKWESDSMMSVARTQPGTIVLDDRLYVIGGLNGTRSLNSTERFSIKKKTWSNCAPLLHAVSYMGIAAFRKKIYTIGGITETSYNTPTTHISKVQCYDPVRNKWTEIGDFPHACYNIKTCIWNEKLLASGGWGGEDDLLKKVYCYATKSAKWEEMKSVQNKSSYLFAASSNFFE